MDVLLHTQHGSHLYGLQNSNSDRDFLTVLANANNGRKYAKQTIVDGLDATVLNLSTFMAQCDKGVPQALEALFSAKADIDLLGDVRQAYRVNTAVVYNTYNRTIKNFALTPDAPFKKRRHAARLTLNRNTLLATGRFDPTMTENEIAYANRLAELEGQTLLDALERI